MKNEKHDFFGDPNKGSSILLWTPKNDPFKVVFRGATENRTRDTRIFSPLLYQLSYGTSRELWLNTIRDYIAHMNYRHALALRSANASLVYVPREPCGVFVFEKRLQKYCFFLTCANFLAFFLQICVFFCNFAAKIEEI